ncbi:MAG: DNA polymerase-3 subunit epsilon [Flavobacteriales bacterium]
MRQIVLDTETTGLEPSAGHKIIEIGCVELVNRKLTGRHYHQYIKPNREIDEGAFEVHGISNEFLADKPTFDAIVKEFLEFIDGAELVIHNAPFDIGFLDHEMAMLPSGIGNIAQRCTVLDTLALARNKHPGQKNNLNALCKRYGIDNSARDLHGALLDSEILADVYLMMTGGQTKLSLGANSDGSASIDGIESIRRIAGRVPGQVIPASEAELQEHAIKLAVVDKKSGGNCMWLQPD